MIHYVIYDVGECKYMKAALFEGNYVEEYIMVEDSDHATVMSHPEHFFAEFIEDDVVINLVNLFKISSNYKDFVFCELVKGEVDFLNPLLICRDIDPRFDEKLTFKVG